MGTIVTRSFANALARVSRPLFALAAPVKPTRPTRHLTQIVLGLLLICTLVPRQAGPAQATIPAIVPQVPVPQTPTQPTSPVTAPVDDASTPLRAWYFAEGNSRNGFETYFTLVNLSDQPAGVTVNYNRDDGIRLMQWLGIEPHARLSLNANDVVGARAFGASFFADQDIVVERTTTWGPGQNGETVVGFAPDGKKGWYFAEGTTRGRATTYFVTQNLTDAPAAVNGIFTRDDGSTEKRTYWLAPRGRDAFRVNDLLADTAFSAGFQADQDVV